MPDKYYTISSLEKAFGVIELMTHKSRWDLRELAKVANLPKATLQRILLTLEELGYVHQEHRGGAYGLTLKFFQLGRKIVSNNSLIDIARIHCRSLLGIVNETVNLCIASGTEMVVVDQQLSRHHLRLDSIIGSSFPIYPSASGKVWLAFQNEDNTLALLHKLQETEGCLAPHEIEPFMEELAQIRNEGVACDYEEIFDGVRCLAAPIFDYSGTIIATLGCSIPIVRITEESSQLLIREVCYKAQLISSQMGASPHSFQTPSPDMLLSSRSNRKKEKSTN